MRLVPADARRAWMDETPDRFAYRCLPLHLANQHGWFVLNSQPLRARWSGGTDIGAVVVERLAERTPTCPAVSHFGSGILTFHVPYLFRAPPGFNLLARGPANLPKDGIAALDGLVEADWAVATFTMNWQFTRRNVWITFQEDEPICMLVAVRRGEMESMKPEIHDLRENPLLEQDHEAWSMSRQLFLLEGKLGLVNTKADSWEKHYSHGTYPGGPSVTRPQHKLALQEFRSVNGDARDPIPRVRDCPEKDGLLLPAAGIATVAPSNFLRAVRIAVETGLDKQIEKALGKIQHEVSLPTDAVRRLNSVMNQPRRKGRDVGALPVGQGAFSRMSLLVLGRFVRASVAAGKFDPALRLFKGFDAQFRISLPAEVANLTRRLLERISVAECLNRFQAGVAPTSPPRRGAVRE